LKTSQDLSTDLKCKLEPTQAELTLKSNPLFYHLFIVTQHSNQRSLLLQRKKSQKKKFKNSQRSNRDLLKKKFNINLMKYMNNQLKVNKKILVVEMKKLNKKCYHSKNKSTNKEKVVEAEEEVIIKKDNMEKEKK
jgi:hypothetical protein